MKTVVLMLAALAAVGSVHAYCGGNGGCRVSCINNSCNYCRGPVCCNTQQCGSCMKSCESRCNAQPCVDSCFSSCITPQPYRSTIPSNRNQASSSQHSANTNDNPVNVTTNLDIVNHINNTNAIYIPVIVNSTNVNNITAEIDNDSSPNNCGISCREKDIIDVEPAFEKLKCCIAVPPRYCSYVNNELKCQQEPYRTCNSQCDSEVLISQPLPMFPSDTKCPWTFYNGKLTPLCRNTADSWPYQKTGQPFLVHPYPEDYLKNLPSQYDATTFPTLANMKIERCGGCFYCNGKHNPAECQKSPDCTSQCKQLLKDNNISAKIQNV